ncbi:MAG: carboxypeptidase regulatory-like domain-containing protein, partial [Planctomycetaceae bacterium]|nr:carboxypeptidase regulatory-like domain-containing protein [Planctomycetaceae bacterium]
MTDTTGRPLPGLRLEARRPGENRGIMEAVPPGPILLASTTTDPAGRALFTLLPEGSSSIAAAGGAWAGPSASALLPRSPGSPPLLLVLHPACGVSGTVRTADGRPAPGVRVFARDRASTQGSVAAEVRTDREGRYNLSGLCRGPCEIWAEPPAGVAQWARTVVLPGVDCADIVLDGGASLRIRFLEEGTGAPLPGARARVRWNPEPSVRVGRTPAEADLLAGEDGTIHLADAPEGRLELLHAAAPGCVSGNSWWGEGVEREPLLVKGLPLELEVRLPRAATVEGRILDPAGRPVAGATVHISLRGPRFWSQGPLQNASAAGWVSTGPDGSYRIERVPAGRALLHASSVSHRPPVEYREGREFEEFPEGMRMELAPGALLRRDLVLEREEFAFVEGCVVDDRGAPLEGVPIYAWGPKVSSGPGGGFRKAVRPGKEREIAAGWEGGPLCRDPIRLDLAQGEVRTGVRFTLADPIVLAGEVRDRSGAPVEEALVALVHESDAAAAEPWTCATLAPAPRGAFRFEGVRPDRIRLVAWGAGGRRGESEVIDLHAGPPPGSTDIVLGEAATPAVLEGIVVDEEGAPIAGAGVGWEHPGSQGAGPVRPVLAVTGGDGRFRIEEGRGKFPLFAFAPGFLPAVRGAATGGSPLTVALQRERSVEGIVVEEGSGRPLPGVLLRGGVPDPDQGGNLRHCVSTRSAADGTFRLAGFPAGNCTVFAASPW